MVTTFHQKLLRAPATTEFGDGPFADALEPVSLLDGDVIPNLSPANANERYQCCRSKSTRPYDRIAAAIRIEEMAMAVQETPES